jgi:hypothetical protein
VADHPVRAEAAFAGTDEMRAADIAHGLAAITISASPRHLIQTSRDAGAKAIRAVCTSNGLAAIAIEAMTAPTAEGIVDPSSNLSVWRSLP